MIPTDTFNLSNMLRGRLAQQILTCWLERAGYRVTRLGIEEVFGEIKSLDREHYLSLGLPDELRTLPDLLVANPAMTWAKMFEVKFRRRFNRRTANELIDTLNEQRSYWPDAIALIVIGQPFIEGARFHQDYIRVIPSRETDRLYGPSGIDIPEDELGQMDLLWNQLPMITSEFCFKDFDCFGDERDERGCQSLAIADYVTAAIRELGKL